MSRGERGKSTPVLAVDTGGTFTDLLLLHGGRVTALKVPSTPTDPAAAVLAGIRRIFEGEAPERYRLILGSTVVTNTLLERSGSRVALITNEGFEDVIEIGRQNRPQLYALTGHRPPPLVGRRDRIGIVGRLDFGGVELSPVDHEQLALLSERVGGAEAIAVVLLHSYSNPAHELAVDKALEGVGVSVSLSSRILPEFREFERTSTTVANAYVAPRVRSYMSRLSRECGTEAIRIMGSNGGALSLDRSLTEPVNTVLSGPAGGVVGAMDWARRAGLDKILSFDMGGTSTDVSLIRGTPLHTREGEVGGIPIAILLLDIHTVGAGGGSIAYLDPAGVLRVGPKSAGAEPGPIAYGKGGTQVTVTDAHVWLGRLPASGLLGGATPLDRDRVAEHIETLAQEAGISAGEAAEGVIEVANAAIERALRVISVERGVDPSDYHLVAFGGAAGLHAADLTQRLGLRGALIPPDPGLLSAYGMLVAPVLRDRSRTVFLPGDDPATAARMTGILDELEGEARAEMMEDGADSASLVAERWVDARYRGQSFELSVRAEDWQDGLHRAHEERYGYRRSTTVDAVTLRVKVEAPGDRVQILEIPAEPGASPRCRDRASVLIAGKELEAPIFSRSDIPPGTTVSGPAIIIEYSATTWCPPGWQIECDRWGILHLSSGKPA